MRALPFVRSGTGRKFSTGPAVRGSKRNQPTLRRQALRVFPVFTAARSAVLASAEVWVTSGLVHVRLAHRCLVGRIAQEHGFGDAAARARSRPARLLVSRLDPRPRRSPGL